MACICEGSENSCGCGLADAVTVTMAGCVEEKCGYKCFRTWLRTIAVDCEVTCGCGERCVTGRKCSGMWF